MSSAPASSGGSPCRCRRFCSRQMQRLPIFETVLRGIKVVGSFVGTRVDLAETFDLHADGRTRFVRESRKLEQVNKAVTELENG